MCEELDSWGNHIFFLFLFLACEKQVLGRLHFQKGTLSKKNDSTTLNSDQFQRACGRESTARQAEGDIYQSHAQMAVSLSRRAGVRKKP